MEQSGSCWGHIPKVVGSNPTPATIKRRCGYSTAGDEKETFSRSEKTGNGKMADAVYAPD